jgi:hypothetical protein
MKKSRLRLDIFQNLGYPRENQIQGVEGRWHPLRVEYLVEQQQRLMKGTGAMDRTLLGVMV